MTISFDPVERHRIVNRAIQASRDARLRRMTWEQVRDEWRRAAEQGR